MGFEALEYLVGRWMDESCTGGPGTTSAGGETWRLILDGGLLQREAWSEYPAQGEHPAFRHEDLLIVFVDSDSEVRALYWDNEGQAIHYRDVHPDPDGKGVGFVSDPAIPGPRHWLQYRFEEPDRLSAVYSLHGPGSPGFEPYVRWSSVRRPTDSREP